MWSGTFWWGMGTSTIAPNVDFTDYTLAPNSSARLSGTISAPTNVHATFSLTTDGIARVWVDDHLLIDIAVPANATTGTVTAVAVEPFVFGARPATFRVDYAHYTLTTPTLLLYWSTGDAAPSIVPPSAFTTDVSPPEAMRQALRARLVAPPVPWQTW